MTRIRTCAVEYLNTKPIVYGLQEDRLTHRFELQYANPSVCAERLQNGLVDLALIPSIEFSRIRKFRPLSMVPDVGVISRQTVASVSLFFNKNLETIETIAVDDSSRTSVALLQIVLREKFDLNPKLKPMTADVDRMLTETDAALIIGDRALALTDRMDSKLDLGEEWNDLTDGLPFVYSFWAGQPDRLSAEDVLALVRSRDMGLDHISEIANAWAIQNNGFPADFYEMYLTKNIHFRLGKEELEGLKEFYSYAYYYGLIDEIPDLHFYGENAVAAG